MFETKTFQDFKSHLTGITCLKCSKLTNVLKLTSPNNAANFLLPCSSDHFFNQEILYFCVWRLAREVVKELTPETTTYWFVATRLSFLLSDKLFTNHGAARGKKAFSTFLPFLEEKNTFPQLRYFFSLHQCQPFVDRPLQSRNGKQSQLGLYFQVSLRSKSDWKL